MVLHLANAQMRLTPPPDNIDSLDSAVVHRFHRKLLGNYSSWCSYLGTIVEIILDLRFLFFQYGIVYQLKIAVFVVFLVIQYARDKYSAKNHIRYRLVQFLLIVLGILVIVALLEFTHFSFVDIFKSLLAFIPTGWGILLIAQASRPELKRFRLLWNAVVSVARLYDILFGILIMVPVAFLSWMPGFQSMQTRILFNEAFSRGLRIMQIVTGKKSKGDV